MTHSLQARYVFPVAGEPIADGIVTFDEKRIISVDNPITLAGKQPMAPVTVAPTVENLGNVAILPGLVNAHAHLELSHLEQPIGCRGMSFCDWIGTLTETLRFQGRPPADAVRRGLYESMTAGVTTLGDISQPSWNCNDFQDTPLDATIFIELIAIADYEVDEKLKQAHQHIAAAVAGKADREKPNWRPGISPHAPYTVHPRLLAEAAAISARHRVPLAFHLAESPEEIEFLRTAGGPFRQMLERLGRWEADAHRPGRRPLDLLQVLAAAHRSLIIHGNYLDDDEIDFIARHTERMSVVYCPRTHGYFAHARHPLAKLLAAGVNVALGTDSRASSPDLSLLSEIRYLAHSRPDIPPQTVLRMATLGGAIALGREQEVGTLEVGKQPNFCIVPLPDRHASDPHHLLFDQNAAVRSTWFHGQA